MHDLPAGDAARGAEVLRGEVSEEEFECGGCEPGGGVGVCGGGEAVGAVE